MLKSPSKKRKGIHKKKKPSKRLKFPEEAENEDANSDKDVTLLDEGDSDVKDLDEKLEQNAAKNNLSAINVRSLIHHVISDKGVIAMLKNATQEEEPAGMCKDMQDVPPYDFKLTRSKLKEVAEKTDPLQLLVPPPLWSSPVKKPPPEKRQQFVDLNLSDASSDDEEYNPENEEVESDSDLESLVSQSSSLASPASLSVPQSPSTPDRSSRQTRSTSHVVPNQISKPIKNDEAFKQPLPVQDDSEEHYSIAKMTRSRVPIETPLVFLEAKFAPPDLTPDMYESVSWDDLDGDDQEWHRWLEGLVLPDEILNQVTEKEEEEDDTDYNIMAEETKEIQEEYRDDKAVRISQKEVNELFDELLRDYDDIFNSGGCVYEVIEEGDTRGKHVFVDTSKSTGVTRESQQAPVFTAEQRNTLVMQLQKHCQLLVQEFLLCSQEPSLSEYCEVYKTYINEMYGLSQTHLNNYQQLMNQGRNTLVPVVCFQGMEESFNLVNSFPVNGSIEESPPEPPKQPEKCPETPTSNSQPSYPVPVLVAETIFSHAKCFPYPELLPQSAVIPLSLRRDEKTNRGTFFPAEDNLLALGLGKFKYGWESIHSHLLPVKAPKQIQIRFKNLCSRRYEQNIFKHFRKKGELLPLPVLKSMRVESLKDWYDEKTNKVILTKEEKERREKEKEKAISPSPPVSYGQKPLLPKPSPVIVSGISPPKPDPSISPMKPISKMDNVTTTSPAASISNVPPTFLTSGSPLPAYVIGTPQVGQAVIPSVVNIPVAFSNASGQPAMSISLANPITQLPIATTLNQPVLGYTLSTLPAQPLVIPAQPVMMPPQPLVVQPVQQTATTEQDPQKSKPKKKSSKSRSKSSSTKSKKEAERSMDTSPVASTASERSDSPTSTVSMELENEQPNSLETSEKEKDSSGNSAMESMQNISKDNEVRPLTSEPMQQGVREQTGLETNLPQTATANVSEPSSQLATTPLTTRTVLVEQSNSTGEETRSIPTQDSVGTSSLCVEPQQKADQEIQPNVQCNQESGSSECNPATPVSDCPTTSNANTTKMDCDTQSVSDSDGILQCTVKKAAEEAPTVIQTAPASSNESVGQVSSFTVPAVPQSNDAELLSRPSPFPTSAVESASTNTTKPNSTAQSCLSNDGPESQTTEADSLAVQDTDTPADSPCCDGEEAAANDQNSKPTETTNSNDSSAQSGGKSKGGKERGSSQGAAGSTGPPNPPPPQPPRKPGPNTTIGSSTSAEVDPKYKERAHAFAEAYMSKVKRVVGYDSPKYMEFLETLIMSQSKKWTPVQLYKNIAEVMKDYGELVEDFVGFLEPNQAVECGVFMENLEYNRARNFLRKLEVHFQKNPQHFQKIIRAFSQWGKEGEKDPEELRQVVIPLLRGQQVLIEEFSLFFGQLKPPPCKSEDFEEVDLGSGSDFDSDDYEFVVIPDVEETDAPKPTRKGRPSAKRGQSRNKRKRLASKDEPLSSKEDITKTNSHKDRILPDSSKTEESGKDYGDDLDKERQEGHDIESGGENMDEDGDITLKAVEDPSEVHYSDNSSSSFPPSCEVDNNTCDSYDSKADPTEAQKLSALTPTSMMDETSQQFDHDHAYSRQEGEESGNEGEDNGWDEGVGDVDMDSDISEEQDTEDNDDVELECDGGVEADEEDDSDDDVGEEEEVELALSSDEGECDSKLEDNESRLRVAEKTHDQNAEQLDQRSPRTNVTEHETDEPMDFSESRSPTTLSAKNVLIGQSGELVIAWTRDDDRQILQACQQRGATEETFQAVAQEIGKNSQEVEKRFRDLLEIFKANTQDDMTEEETEDDCSPSETDTDCHTDN